MIAKDFAQQLFDLHDRVAFVTGAGSGIGQMIALALASAGSRVVCFDLREDGGLKETVNNIEALGGQALYYGRCSGIEIFAQQSLWQKHILVARILP